MIKQEHIILPHSIYIILLNIYVFETLITKIYTNIISLKNDVSIYIYMNYHYKTTEEFMDAYVNGTLNEFNEKLYGDYIDLNFDSDNLFDYNIDLQYKNGCDCVKDNELYDNYESCKCENNNNYWNDKFMWNKIPMFPKNMEFQKYYDVIFPKRIFKNKIFYYLPNGCKMIFTTYIDKSLTKTFDVKRSISYKFINDKLVLVEDTMDAWFGLMFQNYHTPKSKHFIKYINKLNKYQNNNKLMENNFYYSVKTINY